MKKLAIFASGSGSNAQRIYEYFKHNDSVQIELILCNNSNAGVLDRCKKLNIKYIIFDKFDLNGNKVLDYLEFYRIDFIVLAGFLWLMPKHIINRYDKKIINIHPALLPNYGGKGFYGMKVHQAVINNKDKESGITIHYVNEKYDSGDIIFQAKCQIDEKDTVEILAEKIHKLEYENFPVIIERLLNGTV